MKTLFLIILLCVFVQNGRAVRNPWEGMEISCKPEVISIPIEENGCKSKERKF